MYWIAARMAEETPKNVAQIETSGVRGMCGGGLVVPRRRKVTNIRRNLGTKMIRQKQMRAGETNKWIATTEERVIESRQSSLRMGVI